MPGDDDLRKWFDARRGKGGGTPRPDKAGRGTHEMSGESGESGADEYLRRVLDARRAQDATRHKYFREARPLGEILTAYLAASGLARRYELKDLYAAWLSAAGERGASHTAILGVKKGVLHVMVDSSSCLHEMANFRKKEILAALRKTKGCEKIHNIEFRLGSLESK